MHSNLKFIIKVSSIDLGNKIISIGHVKYLIDIVSKDKHKLTNYDTDPKDRQNFASAEKISNSMVSKCLNEYVPDSSGTVLYLNIMNNLITSFMDPNVTPFKRIYLIWWTIFVLRFWRIWLQQQENFNLENNFITSNCYTCVELNGHALVQVMIYLRKTNQSHLFIPILFGSQACESIFRQMRSLSSPFSTIVNCSMLDLIDRFKKIQLQADIVGTQEDITFPIFLKKSEKYATDLSLPSDEDICNEIETAKVDAIDILKQFGINATNFDFDCKISNHTKILDDLNEIQSIEETIEEPLEEPVEETFDETTSDLQQDIHTLSAVTGLLELKDYSELRKSITETSPFTIVIDAGGTEKIVRKSSICWLLTQNKFHFSSDRLQRVRDVDIIKKKKS